MAASGSGRRIWGVGAAVLTAVASLGGMLWLWLGGGFALPRPSVSGPTAVEECGRRISGSSALTARLAPALAASFLRESGYVVAEDPAPLAAGEITVSGERAGLRCSVTVSRSVSLQGFEDLAQGATAIALSQKQIAAPEIERLRQAGAGDFEADRALAEHQFAKDALAIVVNAANPVTRLRVDDVAAISVGLVPHWGFYAPAPASTEAAEPAADPEAPPPSPEPPPTPMVLIAPRDGTAPRDYPNDVVPITAPVFETMQQRARIFETEEAAAAAVAQEPGAFGFFSAAFAIGAPGLRPLEILTGGAAHAPTLENLRGNRYPLVRRMFAYVRPADMREDVFVQRFIAFIKSPAAAEVIEAAGFLPAPLDAPVGAVLRCLEGTAEAATVARVIQDADRIEPMLSFLPGKVELDSASQDALAREAPRLAEMLGKGGQVTVIGHSDVSGDAEANRALALRRALGVRAALEAAGVFGVGVESAGEMCPAFESETLEGRQRNQRVEIWLRAPQAQ